MVFTLTIIFLLTLSLAHCQHGGNNKRITQFAKGVDFSYAIIRSCSGWRLNNLPEMKRFLKEEAKNWDLTVEFSGGDPILHLYNEHNQIVKSDSLVNYDRSTLYEILNTIGIYQTRGGSGQGLKVTKIETKEHIKSDV